METMLLNDDMIANVVDEIKSKEFVVENVNIKFNKKSEKQYYLLVNTDGCSNVVSDEVYFQTFEDNLLYAELRWLNSLIRTLRTSFEATIKVSPNGDFDHENIQLSVLLNVPNEADLNRYLYPRFKTFVLLHPFIKHLEVSGFNNHITSLVFHMNVNGQLISKILDENKVNHRLLEQWMYCIQKCARDNLGRTRFFENIPFLSGKMKYDFKKERLNHYFVLKDF